MSVGGGFLPGLRQHRRRGVNPKIGALAGFHHHAGRLTRPASEFDEKITLREGGEEREKPLRCAPPSGMEEEPPELPMYVKVRDVGRKVH